MYLFQVLDMLGQRKTPFWVSSRTIQYDERFWRCITEYLAAMMIMLVINDIAQKNFVSSPLIQLNFESTCIGEHIVIGTHSG